MSLRRTVAPIWGTDTAVLAIGRTAALLLGIGFLLGVGSLGDVRFVGVLLAVAVATTMVDLVAPRQRVTPLVEAMAVGATLGSVGVVGEPFFPYLIIPAISAGLRAGPIWGLGVSVAVAAAFAAGSVAVDDDPVRGLVWAATAAAAGLLAGWLHATRRQRRALSEQQRYEAATRLLEQLRPLLRPMIGGLDARPLASQLIEGLAPVLPGRSIAVAVCGGGNPRIVASRGQPPPEIVWTELAASALEGSGDLSEQGWARVFPVRSDAGRVSAALMIDGDQELSRHEVSHVKQQLEVWRGRLVAASLFDEVRELATLAERSRIARDMHDSVAQDVASLGYLIDDLQEIVDPGIAIHLGRLREEIGRVVTELRLSIHDLRSEGFAAGGLAGALAEVARREARSAGCAVHLRLQETHHTISTDDEITLLRIAEEALVNIRRHANATNIWVSSAVGPGGVVVTVEDDGQGMRESSVGGFGLQTMTERAVRIGALISFEPRDPQGTRVRVELPRLLDLTMVPERRTLSA